jgi:hypothetical protein
MLFLIFSYIDCGNMLLCNCDSASLLRPSTAHWQAVIAKQSSRAVAMLASSLLFSAVAGCGGQSGPARYDFSGTVTYNGQPVPEGAIQFLPDASKGNEGPATNANIVQGKYDTALSGKGPIGGEHIVIINGFDGKARPEDEMPYGSPLFPEYRSTVDLPKTSGETVNFEVQP